MLHLLLIGVKRGTRYAYGLINKGVGTGFYLTDETTWLKKKESKISNIKERTWSVKIYFIILLVLLGR